MYSSLPAFRIPTVLLPLYFGTRLHIFPASCFLPCCLDPIMLGIACIESRARFRKSVEPGSRLSWNACKMLRLQIPLFACMRPGASKKKILFGASTCWCKHCPMPHFQHRHGHGRSPPLYGKSHTPSTDMGLSNPHLFILESISHYFWANRLNKKIRKLREVLYLPIAFAERKKEGMKTA